MKTSGNGIQKICAHEAVVLKAYPDPATGGEPWTIGVGHTGNVRPGDTITYDEAMALLAEDLVRFETILNNAITVSVTQNQYDALVSFCFNVGGGNFRSSTLLRKLNARDYQGAADEFPKWNKAAGKIMGGLVRRRREERELFLTQDEE